MAALLAVASGSAGGWRATGEALRGRRYEGRAQPLSRQDIGNAGRFHFSI